MQADYNNSKSKWITLLEKRGVIGNGKILKQIVRCETGGRIDGFNDGLQVTGYDDDFLFVKNQYYAGAIAWDQISFMFFIED